MNSKILLTMPRKNGDATVWTYQWGEKAIKIAKEFGYNVIAIKSNDTTYENVSNIIRKYNPRLYIHMGHGCILSLQGNNECMVTKKMDIEKLMDMAEGKDGEIGKQKLSKILNPVGKLYCTSNEKFNCLDNEPCNPICLKDTNIHLLKGSIVFAVACHSALQLGRYAISCGVESYIGYDELMLFPVDSMRSQDITGDIQLEFLRNLLLGKSVRESEYMMRKMEDAYIRMYKKIKYISLPILWNQKYRRILGYENARIYG